MTESVNGAELPSSGAAWEESADVSTTLREDVYPGTRGAALCGAEKTVTSPENKPEPGLSSEMILDFFRKTRTHSVSVFSACGLVFLLSVLRSSCSFLPT